MIDRHHTETLLSDVLT